MSIEHDTPTTEGCACLSRRQTLRAVGVAGAAVAGAGSLAACSAEEVGAAASSAAGAASQAAEAIKAADIPVGGGAVFDSLKAVVTQPTEGEYKAFSAVCTHQGCTVSDVADGVIKCGCHGSEFDIATGDVKKGPATKPLPAKSVSLSGDGLTVS